MMEPLVRLMMCLVGLLLPFLLIMCGCMASKYMRVLKNREYACFSVNAIIRMIDLGCVAALFPILIDAAAVLPDCRPHSRKELPSVLIYVCCHGSKVSHGLKISYFGDVGDVAVGAFVELSAFSEVVELFFLLLNVFK